MKHITRTGTKSLMLFILITMVIASVPQILARQQYATALQETYGTNLCTDCHHDLPNGGKLLTDYGSKFKSQPIYQNDPVAALRNIGAPPGTSPNVTTVTVTNDDTVVPIVTEPNVIVPAVVKTIVEPVETIKQEDDEKSEEGNEVEDVQKKSSGFGIIATIGIVSILYTMRRRKIGKR